MEASVVEKVKGLFKLVFDLFDRLIRWGGRLTFVVRVWRASVIVEAVRPRDHVSNIVGLTRKGLTYVSTISISSLSGDLTFVIALPSTLATSALIALFTAGSFVAKVPFGSVSTKEESDLDLIVPVRQQRISSGRD